MVPKVLVAELQRALRLHTDLAVHPPVFQALYETLCKRKGSSFLWSFIKDPVQRQVSWHVCAGGRYVSGQQVCDILILTRTDVQKAKSI